MLLAVVEFPKQLIGCGDQIVFAGKIVGFEGGAAQHLRQHFLPGWLRERLVLIDELFSGVAHAF